MSSFRLAHLFATGATIFTICAVAIPVLYHDWTTSILWVGAAFISGYMARNETREVREYRRYMRQLSRDQAAARFYRDATDAENKQGLS